MSTLLFLFIFLVNHWVFSSSATPCCLPLLLLLLPAFHVVWEDHVGAGGPRTTNYRSDTSTINSSHIGNPWRQLCPSPHSGMSHQRVNIFDLLSVLLIPTVLLEFSSLPWRVFRTCLCSGLRKCEWKTHIPKPKSRLPCEDRNTKYTQSHSNKLLEPG